MVMVLGNRAELTFFFRFLLSGLQIRLLCECSSVSQVLSALESLPAGINDLYDGAFSRIAGQCENDKLMAQRAISFISCAERNLTVEELRHLLSIKPGDIKLEKHNLPVAKILLSISAGLIQIDHRTNIATLVHHTLQEYLDTHLERVADSPETDLAVACITYMSFQDFDDGPCIHPADLESRLRIYPFLDYAAHYWGVHAHKLQKKDHLAHLASFLKDDAKLMSSTQVLYVSRSKAKRQNVRFPKKRSPLHTLAYWGLFHLLDVLSHDNRIVDEKDSLGWTALHIAAQQGHADVIQFLLAENAHVDLITNQGETALYWAARNGHDAIVTLLLHAGASMEVQDTEGWAALDWAAIRGHDKVIQVILSKFPIAWFGYDGVNKALRLSAEAGNHTTMQLLLDHGAEIHHRDEDGSTALMWAVPEGHEHSVSFLLSHGANVKAKDDYSNTSLHWATPFEKVARLLIVNGADIDAKNVDGQTALDWCAQDGQVDVLRLLLEHGANANSQDRYGFSALHASALKGHEVIVRLLIVHGANPDLKDENGWTALHAAAIGGHTSVVQELQPLTKDGSHAIEWVAIRQHDTNRRKLLGHVAAKKSEGSTAITGLRWAVSDGRIERVRAMLDSGTQVDAEDVGGCTALMIGAYMGQEAIVTLLLDYGASVGKPDRFGKTALHEASEHGFLGVVQCLVERGADTNSETCSWTALLLAARNDHSEIVHYLANTGAQVQAQDYHMRTALHWTAMHGSMLGLQTLVYRGANVDTADRWGRTPLMWAIENSEHSAGEFLLERGAAPLRRADDGSSALHVAAFVGDKRFVCLLLKYGSDIHCKTHDGITAEDIAIRRGFSDIANILSGSTPDRNISDLEAGHENVMVFATKHPHEVVFDDGGDHDDDENSQERHTPCISRYL